MKVMCKADAAEVTYGAAEIRVIAGDHHAATALSETRHTLAILFGDAVAGVDREQPQLVVVGRIQCRHDGVRLGRRHAIACGDLEERRAVSVREAREELAKQAEAADVPVIVDVRDGGLKQNFGSLAHGASPDY